MRIVEALLFSASNPWCCWLLVELVVERRPEFSGRFFYAHYSLLICNKLATYSRKEDSSYYT